MATKKITFDPTAGVPVASNLTIYGGSNFDATFTVVDVGNAAYGFEPQDIEYKDYTFTADNLPSFGSYRIKIVLTSKNQAYVPRMKDLRVLALA